MDYICSIHNCYDKARLYVNFETNTTTFLCSSHTECTTDDFKKITYAPCQHDNCYKRPYYNYANSNYLAMCREHKTKGMIRKNNKECANEKCKIHPCYNYPHMKNGLYCKTHCLEGMTNIKHRRCEYYGCKLYPCYGYTNKSPKWCKSHAPTNTINLKKKICEKCELTASFGFETENIRKYCEFHSTEGMTNLNKKRKNVFDEKII